MIVFAGGMYYPKYYPVPCGTGTFLVTNKPVRAKGWWMEKTGLTIFASTGHCLSGTSSTGFGSNPFSGASGIRLYLDARARFDVDNALAGNDGVDMSKSAQIDLNGHSVTIGNLHATTESGHTPQVVSAAPGVLTVTQLATTDAAVVFTGAASLRKAGTGELRLFGDSSSTGTVEVTAGTLTLAPSGEVAGGTWQKAASVSVTGGTLKLGRSDAFGRQTDMHLDAGTLNLAFSGQQRIANLYLDGSGTRCDLGLWGAADNESVPAAHRTARITGTGVLFVRGTNPGLVIIVK